ncbi:MAG: dihydrofolate reductase [Lachnospiraceae bacterium]|nr:dihydrofolate reductase [Lachnospiraceae bacterium]
MKLIVAVDRNWGIGYGDQLLVSIPNDHKNFRELTTGKVVVLGRKTLATFPQGKPLKYRTNVIFSTDPKYEVDEETIVVHSLEEFLEKAKKFDDNDIYVIGGGSIYKLLLPYCNEAVVTKLDHAYRADTYFPNLDEDPAWQVVSESEEMTYFDIPYRFVTYKRA